MSSSSKADGAIVSVPSPCTSVCKMDPRTGWCEGCLRTIAEIASWSTLDDAGKLAVWERLAERREHLHAQAEIRPAAGRRS